MQPFPHYTTYLFILVCLPVSLLFIAKTNCHYIISCRCHVRRSEVCLNLIMNVGESIRTSNLHKHMSYLYIYVPFHLEWQIQHPDLMPDVFSERKRGLCTSNINISWAIKFIGSCFFVWCSIYVHSYLLPVKLLWKYLIIMVGRYLLMLKDLEKIEYNNKQGHDEMGHFNAKKWTVKLCKLNSKVFLSTEKKNLNGTSDRMATSACIHTVWLWGFWFGG